MNFQLDKENYVTLKNLFIERLFEYSPPLDDWESTVYVEGVMSVISLQLKVSPVDLFEAYCAVAGEEIEEKIQYLESLNTSKDYASSLEKDFHYHLQLVEKENENSSWSSFHPLIRFTTYFILVTDALIEIALKEHYNNNEKLYVRSD